MSGRKGSRSNGTLEEWHGKGFYEILERIFLSLPLALLLSCKKVNNRWESIVLDCLQSQHSTACRLKDNLISEQWRTGKPTKRAVARYMKETKWFEPFHMISNDKDVVFAAKDSCSTLTHIVVLDGKTLVETQRFNVRQELGCLNSETIRLAISDKYLVANIFLETEYHAIIWKRCDHGFALKPLRLKQGLGKVKRSQLNYFYGKHYTTPKIVDEIMCLPILSTERNEDVVETVSLQRDLTGGSFVEVKRKPFGEGRSYFNFFTSGKNLFFNWEAGKIGLYESDETEIWQQSKEQFRPNVEHWDPSHVVVIWRAIKSDQKILEIYQNSDGRMKQTIEVSNYFMHTSEVQMQGGRVAISGWTKSCSEDRSSIDMIVFDVATGEKILSVKDDLQIRVNLAFVLEKERLLFTLPSGALLAAKFWI